MRLLEEMISRAKSFGAALDCSLRADEKNIPAPWILSSIWDGKRTNLRLWHFFYRKLKKA